MAFHGGIAGAEGLDRAHHAAGEVDQPLPGLSAP